MTETTRAEAPPRAGRREWVGLAMLALACLLYSMDLTVLNLALPAISADLEPSSAQLLWIVDVYGFVLAGSLITRGTLGLRHVSTPARPGPGVSRNAAPLRSTDVDRPRGTCEHRPR